MTKGFKYVLALIFLGLFFGLQRSLIVDWAWLAGLNFILVGCLFFTITNHSIAWLWTVVGGILLDSSALLPFGAHLILLIFIVWILKLLLWEVFSHLSGGASLALAFGGVFIYYLLLILSFILTSKLGIISYHLVWDWILWRGFAQACGLNFLLTAVCLIIYRWRLKEYLIYDQGPFWHSN